MREAAAAAAIIAFKKTETETSSSASMHQSTSSTRRAVAAAIRGDDPSNMTPDRIVDANKRKLCSSPQDDGGKQKVKKVARKKYTKECSADGCTKQARKGGVCTRHGAKRQCSREGCMNHAQKGGVCKRHGAKVEVKLCSYEDCTNNVVKGGVCLRHGATRKLCSSDGCTNQVQRKGLCRRHGAYHNPSDQLTTSCAPSARRSAFDYTTAPYPIHHNATGPPKPNWQERGGGPLGLGVIVCQVIDYIEE